VPALVDPDGTLHHQATALPRHGRADVAGQRQLSGGPIRRLGPEHPAGQDVDPPEPAGAIVEVRPFAEQAAPGVEHFHRSHVRTPPHRSVA